MHKYRVPIPLGHVAFNAQEAFNIARSFGSDFGTERGSGQFVVKAQVRTSGRTGGYFKENGFHGGIHTVTTLAEVQDIAGNMLGKKYINEHTEEQGVIVSCVYI